MSKTLRRWRQVRRYRSTAKALHSLSPKQLSAHGIRPSEIDHLACQASRVEWR